MFKRKLNIIRVYRYCGHLRGRQTNEAKTDCFPAECTMCAGIRGYSDGADSTRYQWGKELASDQSN